MKWRPQFGLLKKQSILANASADGTVKYWHTTSGKLLHTIEEKGNGIYTLDFNSGGNRVVTAGSDTHVRLYDDETQEIISVFKEGDEKMVSHFNRVFSVKFDPSDEHLIYSGGWDKIININDTRVKAPVAQIEGPYLSADTLDIHNNDLLVGNYRTDDPLEIYDIRKYELIQSFRWDTEDGGKGGLVLGSSFSVPYYDTIIA